jgi:hypothetical protein
MDRNGTSDLKTAIDGAANARIAVFITFHYRPDHLYYLCRVIAGLAAYCVRRVDVTIVTDAGPEEELASIARLCKLYLSSSRFEIIRTERAHPPQMLTWRHKPLLVEAMRKSMTAYSHFIYLEDDIYLTFRNFIYFLQYRAALATRRLIPGYLRVEFKHSDRLLYSSDAVTSTRITDANIVEVDGCTFVSHNYPYCALFVMDREMIEEYVSSRSFDFEKSKEVSDWTTSPRAAMGLCWDNPPAGFIHRYVLPIDPVTLVPLPFSFVEHLPNNYANSETVEYLGKLRVDQVIV